MGKVTFKWSKTEDLESVKPRSITLIPLYAICEKERESWIWPRRVATKNVNLCKTSFLFEIVDLSAPVETGKCVPFVCVLPISTYSELEKDVARNKERMH